MLRNTCAVLLAVAGVVAGVRGQTRQRTDSPSGEWRTFGSDLHNTRYSSLDQITKANFNNLEVAWRFKADALGPRPEFNLQATPLFVNRRIYSTAGARRAVVALDAQTGEMLWMHSEQEGSRGDAAPRPLSGRGLAYWSDGHAERVLYVTPGYRLIALDAKTGVLAHEFGHDGVIDLKTDDDQDLDPITAEVGLHATPVVAKDIVIIGAAHRAAGAPPSKRQVKGYVRAYDVRTGKRLWIVHTIPLPGEFGNDTWEKDSWSYTGNAGVWAQISVDEELNTVYLPVELPTGDYYGGYRPGNGLFGESLLAVDLKTGQRKWHYQLVHHGLWDMDIPCAPILADIRVDGRSIKAIAQPTKQGWVYVLDRVTGRPVWPIEERPVEKGTVPGEWYASTQPFVTKPPAFERQGVTVDELIDFTSALRAEAEAIVKRYKIGPLFTPPVVSQWPAPLGTLVMPSVDGGVNWPGGSLDPETQMLYLYSRSGISPLGLIRVPPTVSDFEWQVGIARNPAAASAIDRFTLGVLGDGGLSVQGLPLVKPPYGRITAIDLNKGEIVWQVAHGDTPDYIKNHPALKGIEIPRTGRPGRIGTLVTKTLLIAGEGGFATQANGQRGALLRAYDKASGEDAGAVYMPAAATGAPMTYLLDGRQYVTIAIGGPGYSGELLTFKLPSEGPRR